MWAAACFSAAWIVKFCVAVTVDETCDVAVTVTTLFVGTALGAVYSPALLMVPALPLPPLLTATLQFTSVLLRFWTVAVHWEVVETVTSVGVHETVIVGVFVDDGLEPQELKIASNAANPTRKAR